MVADPREQLEKLLVSLFDAGSLRRFLRYGPSGDAIARELPGETASPAEVAFKAVQLLEAHGLLDDALCRRLVQARPNRADEIERVLGPWCVPRPSTVDDDLGAAVTSEAVQPAGDEVRVLFLAANPGPSSVPLDAEAREIDLKIRSAEHRDCIRLITCWAVRPGDVFDALLRHAPHVVHFAGIGDAEAIVLAGDGGEAARVTPHALGLMFGALKDNVRVVVLNRCYAPPQAEAIAAHIDCVVGLAHARGHVDAARTFAASFYRAIGYGRPVANAYEQSRAALAVEGYSDQVQPALHVRAGVDASAVFLVAAPDSAPVARSGR